MFLHALHSSDAAHQQILIKSSGTDVEVLACNFREYISADINISLQRSLPIWKQVDSKNIGHKL